jgi:hypothetical protein
MKGCARSLALGFSLYLACAAAIACLLVGAFGLPIARTWPIALGAGLFIWVGLALIGGIVDVLRERASIGACLRGEHPVDGRQASLVGTITTTHPLLRAPLSGTLCLAYKYVISMLEQSGKHRSIVPVVEGIAIVPSTITTPCGSFRLLVVPTIEPGDLMFSVDAGIREATLRNAAEHLRTGTFDSPGKVVRGTLEKQLTDDDGAFQIDQNHSTQPITLDQCRFQESVIKSGQQVYVHGLYSEQRGGLVPHPNWAKDTRILTGDIDEVTRKLGRKIRNYTLGGVIFCGIGAGIVAYFLHTAGKL